jgi:phosphoglycolate phosphatase
LARLILFDIDGTLLTAHGAPRRAFEHALVEAYGTAGPIDTHRFDGKTDPQIARELLELAGFDAAAIDAGFATLWTAYLRELRAALAAPGHVTSALPGVHALLDALGCRNGACVVGLLTGNIRPGAELKLGSAGIAATFAVGAFGSDHERRDRLPALAVERAYALTGREFRGRDIVIIGDTPNDVTCGSTLGVRAIGVATGNYSAGQLRAAGADLVLDDMADTDAVLTALLD